MSEMQTTETNEPTSPAQKPETVLPTGAQPIDPALIEKMASLRMLVSIDTILTNCLFPGGAAADILGAKQFLQRLHAPMLQECQSHPDFARASNPNAAAPISPKDLVAKEKAAEKRNRKARRTRAN